jgi:hypothetical protein
MIPWPFLTWLVSYLNGVYMYMLYVYLLHCWSYFQVMTFLDFTSMSLSRVVNN